MQTDARRLGPAAALTVALILGGALALHAGRGTTFYYDDWNFVLERLDWTTWQLLRPHNEHLSVVPVFVYKAVLELFGLDSYGVLRTILAAADVLCGLLLFLYARRRVGAWIAAGLAATLVVMAPAFWDIVWSFQIGFLFSLAAGLGVLLAFDRGDRAGDGLACALLAVALGSSSLGLPILAVAILEVVLRPDRRARWWVPGVPLLLYGAWYVKYGSGGTPLANLTEIPRWIVDASDDAAGAILAFGAEWGRLAVVALVVLTVSTLARTGRPSPRLAALIALPLVFWALTAFGRADTPGVTPSEARYLYPGGLWLALLAVELGGQRELRPHVQAAIAGVLALAALANANALDPASAQLRSFAEASRGSATALDASDPARVPSPTLPEPGQPQLIAHNYFAAREQYGGTPGYSPGELPRAPEGARAAVDRSSLILSGPAVSAGRSGGADCREVPGTDAQVPLPATGLLIRPKGIATVEIRLRRYASSFGEPLTTVQPGTSAVVRLAPDRLPQPWTVRLDSAGPIALCAPS